MLREGLSEKVAFEQRPKKKVEVGFPGVPVVRMLRFSLQGARVRSQVWEISCPHAQWHGQKKKKGVGAVVISYPPSGD